MKIIDFKQVFIIFLGIKEKDGKRVWRKGEGCPVIKA